MEKACLVSYMNMLYIGFDDLAIVKKSSNGNHLLESYGISGESLSVVTCVYSFFRK